MASNLNVKPKNLLLVTVGYRNSKQGMGCVKSGWVMKKLSANMEGVDEAKNDIRQFLKDNVYNFDNVYNDNCHFIMHTKVIRGWMVY